MEHKTNVCNNCDSRNCHEDTFFPVIQVQNITIITVTNGLLTTPVRCYCCCIVEFTGPDCCHLVCYIHISILWYRRKSTVQRVHVVISSDSFVGSVTMILLYRHAGLGRKARMSLAHNHYYMCLAC